MAMWPSQPAGLTSDLALYALLSAPHLRRHLTCDAYMGNMNRLSPLSQLAVCGALICSYCSEIQIVKP